MNIVIVESPAKAKTINKYLGSEYQVMASFGHVRDLPAKDGSVQPDDDFAMTWDVDAKSQKRLNEIARAVKDADKLILATDPDREGEAISWHVLDVLRKKRVLKDKPVERVVFNAITKKAILEAMAQPRDIDEPLVDAYLARRALDYLVGFTLSPVLWRKLPGARSAGRVQSVALRLVCDREAEIERFVSQEYWSILANLKTSGGAAFQARIASYNGKKLARLGITSKAQADEIAAVLNDASLAVSSVESKPQRRHPAAPFTTSTLQQEASRKCGFAAARTMQIAQKLYEGTDIGGETVGLITYMRTDGVQIAGEAIASARKVIGADYSLEMWPLFGGFATPEFIAEKETWTETWVAEMQAGQGEGGASFSAFQFGSLPAAMEGEADAALMIRALHNVHRFESEGGFLTQALGDMYAALKPGGALGIIQHRGPEANSDEWASGSNGYLKQSRVIELVEAAGFELVEASELNANPADQPTEDDFVWRLPPRLAGSDDNPEQREAMLAIGESDRMTLLFRKPE